MIVEDDAELTEMFTTMLGLYGYRVVAAHGVGAAITAIGREHPDAILLDVMMPDASGLDLCRYLRREPEWADLPIIVISARSRREDIETGLQAGATAYLTKPLDMNKLLEMLRKHVGS